MNEQELRTRILDRVGSAGVADYVVELRPDSMGAPAAIVTVVLRDEDARRLWPDRETTRTAVEAVIVELMPDRFPHVWFSTESEALDPEAPGHAAK